MKRYPHTATIFWSSTVGTVNSIGVYSVTSTLQTVGIYCNIQPASASYKARDGGDRIDYKYHVFCPLVSDSVPSGAKLEFQDKSLPIRELFNYQRHTEILV